MDRFKRELQHLGLPTAAVLVHVEFTGSPPNPLKPAAMRRVLDDIARALSNVMPIYVLDVDSGVPKEIPAFDLLDATFERGAHVLVTAQGTEIRGLSVRRGDLNEAIALLRRAGFAIRK